MFFQEIATKLIRTMGETGNYIIYRIDTRLRPYGNSGPLSVSTSVLKTYYGGSQARIWEKLALLRSRPIVLNGFDENEMKATLHRLSFGSELDQETIVNEICILRRRTLSDSDSAGYDLKRASGGLHELELIVQGLQLSGYQILVEPPSSHIHDAIDQLQRIRLLDDSEASILKEGYFIYRQIELALRLYRNRCTNTIEIQAEEIAFLEKMICDRSSSAEMPLLEKLAFHRKRIGQLFQARFSSAGPPKVSATI